MRSQQDISNEITASLRAKTHTVSTMLHAACRQSSVHVQQELSLEVISCFARQRTGSAPVIVDAWPGEAPREAIPPEALHHEERQQALHVAAR